MKKKNLKVSKISIDESVEIQIDAFNELIDEGASQLDCLAIQLTTLKHLLLNLMESDKLGIPNAIAEYYKLTASMLRGLLSAIEGGKKHDR